MKKKTPSRKVSATILALALILATLPSLGFSKPELAYAGQADQSSLEPSETIYLSTFLASTYGTLGWAQNLYFDFNNTIGIPLNTSLPVFDQHFQSADYSLQQGMAWDEYFMVLTVSYDAISVDLAENRTDEICSQFQQAFNLGLSVNDSWYQVDNSTGYVTVYRRLGMFNLKNTAQDQGTIEELTKYKPDSGFGQLIGADFLSHWLSSSSKGGLIDLEYTLKRVDQNTLSWRFVVGFEPAWGDILADETRLDVNLNDVLNHSGPIAPSGQGLSKIQLDIENYEANEYNMTLESIAPQYTSIETEGEGNVLVTYNLTSPIDNVAASIEIAKLESTNNLSWTTAAIVAVVLLGLAASCLAYTRRRRRLRKHVGPEKTAEQGVK
jgi:hypothetical protein